MNIGIYIYDGAEVLDFSGPFEVFSTAKKLCKEPNIFGEIFLVSEDKNKMICARNDFQVVPNYGFENHPKIDALITVGGNFEKIEKEMVKPNVKKWILGQAKTATIVASVCTGAFFLAEAGIFKEYEVTKVTTHWLYISILRDMLGKSVTVIKDQRWVEADEGQPWMRVDNKPKIITSAGISAGIDMSLHVVNELDKLHNKRVLAEKTAMLMEYDWQRNLARYKGEIEREALKTIKSS